MTNPPIGVIVVGAAGKMGEATVRAVLEDSELKLIAAVVRTQPHTPVEGVTYETNLATCLARGGASVVIDMSTAGSVAENAELAFAAGASPVIGATGMTAQTIKGIEEASLRLKIPAMVVPNFAIGAVLMMRFAAAAARWMPDVEIIEMHHERKADAPSGTSMRTAELIDEARILAKVERPTTKELLDGATGASYHNVNIHSVRLPGLLAHQQVIFGAPGETLTLRHDSSDRKGFMHGVILCAKRVRTLSGLTIGLDALLDFPDATGHAGAS